MSNYLSYSGLKTVLKATYNGFIRTKGGRQYAYGDKSFGSYIWSDSGIFIAANTYTYISNGTLSVDNVAGDNARTWSTTTISNAITNNKVSFKSPVVLQPSDLDGSSTVSTGSAQLSLGSGGLYATDNTTLSGSTNPSDTLLSGNSSLCANNIFWNTNGGITTLPTYTYLNSYFPAYYMTVDTDQSVTSRKTFLRRIIVQPETTDSTYSYTQIEYNKITLGTYQPSSSGGGAQSAIDTGSLTISQSGVTVTLPALSMVDTDYMDNAKFMLNSNGGISILPSYAYIKSNYFDLTTQQTVSAEKTFGNINVTGLLSPSAGIIDPDTGGTAATFWATDGSKSVLPTYAYLNSRVIHAGATTTWGKGCPEIGTDGVMEVGKYIDFHTTSSTAVDYNVRLTPNMINNASASSVTVKIPQTDGTILVNTPLASAGQSQVDENFGDYQLALTNGGTGLVNFTTTRSNGVVCLYYRKGKTLTDSNDILTTPDANEVWVNDILVFNNSSGTVHICPADFIDGQDDTSQTLYECGDAMSNSGLYIAHVVTYQDGNGDEVCVVNAKGVTTQVTPTTLAEYIDA